VSAILLVFILGWFVMCCVRIYARVCVEYALMLCVIFRVCLGVDS